MTGRPDAPPPVGDGVARFVRTWTGDLRGTVCLPLRPAECEQVLTGFAERLAAALVAGRFNPAEGSRVGTDLVAAGYSTPEALGRTVTAVTTRLIPDLRLPDPAQHRLGRLVETLVCGFTEAVRDRALDAQEAVRTAALIAQTRAEQALRDSEAKALQLATHDPVTGLPNRTLLTHRLHQIIAGAAPTRVGVCCLDLDRFAAVNDALGHRVGDRLLVAVADRLTTLATPGGWLVARLESDQFAILVEGTTGGEDAVKVADQALSLLAVPFYVDDFELPLPLTASAGVIENVAAGEAAGMIQAAQVALHWAKQDGRARWRLYCHDRAAADTNRYRLSAAMPTALRRGEFTLAYQPLVDLTTGRLVGVEALARWHHPEHGPLPAHRFIDLAEHTGLIVPLGNQLLAQACEQAARWQQQTAEAPYVSVNVSAAQLHHPGFVGYVAQVLDNTRLEPHLLQLEITEHAIIDTNHVSTTLQALVSLGVRIAIDDFGTGYSNLTRLRDLPLHTLKLDAALAQPTPTSRDKGNVFVSTVVSLGHTLGLAVTAEGIETAAHAQRMHAAGCDTGQGWHLGRPQPAHQLALPIMVEPSRPAVASHEEKPRRQQEAGPDDPSLDS